MCTTHRRMTISSERLAMKTLSIKRKPNGLFEAPEKPIEAAEVKPVQTEAKAEKDAPAKPKKAGASKAAKARRKKVNRLIEHWPELFSRDEPKPLKVGILHLLASDIEAKGTEFGTGSLKAALAGYTKSIKYLEALAAGGHRYDLTGQPCGEVTPEQQIIATASLAKRRKGHAQDS